jgi:DNA-binding GntR family transcriptional regulator
MEVENSVSRGNSSSYHRGETILGKAERSKSLRARVTERLRRAILDAEFALGQPLSEEKLAAAFGVSRTPVKDALTALQLEGLIEIRPQRGSFVFRPSETDIARLCEFREMMEVRALSLCFADRRDITLAQLRRANDAVEFAYQRNDRAGWMEADGEFHEVLVRNCDNNYLVDSYKLVSGQVAALRNHSRSTDLNRAIIEHKGIIDAMGNKDLLQAQQILSHHILKMREVYVVSVRSAISAKSSENIFSSLATLSSADG